MNNLLITGPPRCGKTTLIKKISHDVSLSNKVGGFITEELREKGERVGFKITSLPDNKEGLLARKGFSSPYRVGNYGVNTKDLENIGCSAISEALYSGKIILVDEIGKMELFSKIFKNILAQALDSPQKMLATIMERRNEFVDRIKNRKDVKLVHLSRKNFNNEFTEILNWFKMP